MPERRYYWLKLYDSFFENKTSKYIRRLPDGDKVLICYLKFQLRLLKTEGVFIFDNLCENMAEEMKGQILVTPLEELRKANGLGPEDS